MRSELTAIAVSITPFDKDGRLDLEGFERHLELLVENNLIILVGGSGTEEGFTLDPAERRALVETAVAIAGDRTGVRLNVREPRQIREAVADVELAADLGCSAVHVPILDVGHGYRPRDNELRRYFRQVTEAASLPVVISSSQVMGQTVPVPILAEAAAEWGIFGVVCSTSDLAYVTRVIDAIGERCDVYTAGVAYLANALSLGGAGFLSPDANIAPEHCAAIAEAWRDRDFERFFAEVAVMVRLGALSMTYGATALSKLALRTRTGLETYVREPRLELDETVELHVVEALRHALLQERASKDER
jgi:4-hydroxy-tetrahydrodipicolinate synthase